MSRMSNLAIEIQNGDRIVTNEYRAQVRFAGFEEDGKPNRYTVTFYAWASDSNEACQCIHEQCRGGCDEYTISSIEMTRRGVRI